ncbi:hypothetical protein Nepgr_031369 [Nepenthes gracilis]|uniref:Uncharacterized protein n=1 Tax=Nepenthes gracilis TaxID=150966 RepID=A0AAD3TIC5_NEPGR|nr:hypothetical protein Nepgr_031369 [Nepenthes gracilis]
MAIGAKCGLENSHAFRWVTWPSLWSVEVAWPAATAGAAILKSPQASRPCTASTVDTRHSKPAREDGDSAIGHSQDQSARQQHGENERITGHQIATNKLAALLLQIQHHAQQHHTGAISRYPIHQQQQWRITSPRFIRPGPAANPTANVLTAAEDQHQQNGQ